ncbi:MAG: hypothetical protein WD733_12370 [Bryobacterales bacterium]
MILQLRSVIAVIVIVLFEVLVSFVCGSARRVHVWGIKYHAIKRIVFERQLSAIDASLDVAFYQFVGIGINVSPEHSSPIGYISNLAADRHIEFKDMGEDCRVCADMGGKNQIVGGNPSWGLPRSFALPTHEGWAG